MRDFENQEQQDGDEDDVDQVQGPPETRAIPAGPLPAPLVDQQTQATVQLCWSERFGPTKPYTSTVWDSLSVFGCFRVLVEAHGGHQVYYDEVKEKEKDGTPVIFLGDRYDKKTTTEKTVG